MSELRITPDRTDAHCRSCGSTDLTVFLSLGNLPLSDGFLEARQLIDNEPRYPLDVAFCANCSLVQILETVPPEELFGSDYPYFSSFTYTLLRHSESNVKERIEERRLGASSLVVELASNDGYLLQYYKARGVPVLGIDPAPGPVAAHLWSDVLPGAVRSKPSPTSPTCWPSWSRKRRWPASSASNSPA